MNALGSTPPYRHTPLFPLEKDETSYRKLFSEGVRVENALNEDVLVVERSALRALSEAAFVDINHLLRPGHLKQLRSILDDPEASANDKFVAFDFLKNANIAAGGVLPMCQDTGTAIIMGKKGRLVFSDGEDEAALAEGARDMKTLKLASCRYLDTLPKHGSENGHAFRDIEMEEEVHKLTQSLGVGAQFGGKYFCHDVRVIRLPRHGASLPIGLGVSCSADRQALGKITREGVFLEELERNPAKYLPEIDAAQLGGAVVQIDLRRPMKEILAQLAQNPIKTRLSLSGPMIVARDLAHAKLRERLERGQGLPPYFKNHPVYYAGPAKTPQGYASGAFGPTTAGRMDSFVAQFQAAGGSMVMLAKGNRSPAVRDACEKYGGFYLASIGGSAANLAEHCIKKVETIEYPELGMEAIWRIEVENFPAFIVIDDKGNDFFKELNLG